MYVGKTHSLLPILLLIAACAARVPEPVVPEAVPDDPELLTACTPDWRSPPPPVCAVNAEGKSVLDKTDPSFAEVQQLIVMDRDAYGSLEANQEIVRFSTRLILDEAVTPCVKQLATWHRALALAALSLWRDAFLDFGALVKAGPNGPLYPYIGKWVAALREHLPSKAFVACLSVYDPPAAEETSAAEEAKPAPAAIHKPKKAIKPIPQGLPRPDGP